MIGARFDSTKTRVEVVVEAYDDGPVLRDVEGPLKEAAA